VTDRPPLPPLIRVTGRTVRGGAFCAGLELEERAGVLVVVRPAPILRRFDGWKWSAARAAMIALGWKGERVG
jgi:hypothetical protein